MGTHVTWCLLLILCLSGCGGVGAVLSAAKPGVVANVQAGKTNTQTVGTTTVNEQKLVKPVARKIEQTADNTSVRGDKIETVVVQEGAPIWLIVAFAVALFMDSPLRWPGQIMSGLRDLRDMWYRTDNAE